MLYAQSRRRTWKRTCARARERTVVTQIYTHSCTRRAGTCISSQHAPLAHSQTVHLCMTLSCTPSITRTLFSTQMQLCVYENKVTMAAALVLAEIQSNAHKCSRMPVVVKSIADEKKKRTCIRIKCQQCHIYRLPLINSCTEGVAGNGTNACTAPEVAQEAISILCVAAQMIYGVVSVAMGYILVISALCIVLSPLLEGLKT